MGVAPTSPLSAFPRCLAMSADDEVDPFEMLAGGFAEEPSDDLPRATGPLRGRECKREKQLAEAGAACGDRFVTYATGGMQGWRRTMEDTHVVVQLPNGAACFAVFDGHGGPGVAKRVAEMFPEKICAAIPFDGDVVAGLHSCFGMIDMELRAEGASLGTDAENAYDTVGTTALVVIVHNSTVTCAHLGDSIAIYADNGAAMRLNGPDHKPDLPQERARIEAQGGVVDVVNGSYRIDGGLNVSRAFGDFRDKDPSQPMDQTKIIPVPDILVTEISATTEYVMLACDGIFEMLDIPTLDAIIRPSLGGSLTTVVEQLLDTACTSDPEASAMKGTDNETVILIRMQG